MEKNKARKALIIRKEEYQELVEGNQKHSRHTKGRFCSECGKKVPTKKVGKVYFCKKCRILPSVIKNKFQ